MDASSHASPSKSSFSDANSHLSGLDAQTVAILLEQAADIALILDDGVVRDVAIASEELRKTGFAANWIGRRWIDTVSIDSHTKIEALLKSVDGKSASRPRQVNHPSGGLRDIPVAYRLVRAMGRGPVIALGRDLRDIAELQQKLVKAQQEIERDYARLRKAEARYKMVFEAVAEPILIVTADDLIIESANRAAGALLGHDTHDLANEDFPSLFSARAVRAVERMSAKALATGNAAAEKIELASGKKVSLSASVFGQGGDARLVVKFVGEATASKAGETTRDQLLRTLEALPDAFVVTDDELRILAANQAFLEMAHLSEEEQATGARLSKYLGRSTTDLNVLVSTLKNNGNARNFATVLRDRFNTEEQVEVSAVSTGAGRLTYYAFSVRIVSRRLPSGPPPGEELPRSVDHLTNLVGRMPLKDIVRDSTSLIERLCIEAALKLTDDNRASAAEILGLSRQGLYSKLKRFGIEDKN
ncbi:MAG: transcriptional regulator PpsR [Hyphomonas sp.]|uniref:transcriptional regulator PpsR n=1 Tax=Hyphomonas sp. TaxID=87 RepID=UPI0034A07CF3